MLSLWQTECQRMVHVLLGRPDGVDETVLAWAVAAVCLAAVMKVVTRLTGVAAAGELRLLLALATGIGVGIASGATASVCFLPPHPSAAVDFAARVGVPVVVMLVVAVPVQAYFLKARYTQALISFGTATAVAALMLVVLHYGFETFAAGEKESVRIRHRKAAIEDFLAR